MSTASIPTVGSKSRDSKSRPAEDYLLSGVAIMLLINVVQRMVGFLRGVGFCHFLTEDQLGIWALANSFFVIGIPVAFLGLPGSFGKFVEHYRRKNQLGDYLLNVLMVSSLGIVGMVSWMLFLPEQFGWLIFNCDLPYYVSIWFALAFVSLVAFTLVHEIVNSLCHVRTVAIMQFVQSVTFAAVGLPLIAATNSWVALLPSFALGCAAACVPGLWVIFRKYIPELKPSGELNRHQMWRRIAPFAIGLWVLDFMGNLFEVGDRYMLLHLSEGGFEVGQSAVGQYHCGRIVPNLLVSVSVMLGAVLLPFFSVDWEAGHRERITSRVRHGIQLMCIGCLIISVIAMVLSPLLFEHVFGQRYAAAESILPITLAHAVWVSLYLVAQTCMLCAERSRELVGILVIGLSVNFGLNYVLIQSYGLVGAVSATTAACLLAMLLLLWRISRNEFALGAGTIVLCLSPLCILLGPLATTLALVAIALVAGRTNWLLADKDREQIDEIILPQLARIGLRWRTIWL